MAIASANLSVDQQAALADLVSEFCFVHDVDRPGTSDLLRMEQVVTATDRLREIRDRIDRDGLVVAGSRKQARPHPLLASERALQRQIDEELERLWLTPRHRATAAQVRAANEMTRWTPRQPEADEA